MCDDGRPSAHTYDVGHTQGGSVKNATSAVCHGVRQRLAPRRDESTPAHAACSWPLSGIGAEVRAETRCACNKKTVCMPGVTSLRSLIDCFHCLGIHSWGFGLRIWLLPRPLAFCPQVSASLPPLIPRVDEVFSWNRPCVSARLTSCSCAAFVPPILQCEAKKGRAETTKCTT